MTFNKMLDKSENNWGLLKMGYVTMNMKEVIKSSLSHQKHTETGRQTYQPIGRDPSIQAR